ncbi:MAG: hypothetical protein LQ341_007489, partial [Variospora aurantia]
MTSITAIQERKEQAIDRSYKPAPKAVEQTTQTDAARTLQRTYRGHRARRELKGLSLSPSVRWSEAIKEAKYRDLTTPRPASSSSRSRSSRPQTSSSSFDDGRGDETSGAQRQWRRVGDIARRAGGDEYSAEDAGGDDGEEGLSVEEREERRRERMKTARTMDLAYFLEMGKANSDDPVDHRYGSHLRKYHAEWKTRPTRENFFYWLDHGEGLGVSLPNCSRDKLDSMRVRYLGREERVNYAVEVDGQGKLCWKRNGLRVNTTEQWRDSVKGIVRVEDDAPSPSEGLGFYVSSSESSELESGDDHDEGDSASDPAERSKIQKPAAASAAIKTGWKEIAHDAKAKVWDRRPFKRSPKEADRRKKEKKKQQWIFQAKVADTSYNLYIGIKQSGAFQHSSFLHG